MSGLLPSLIDMKDIYSFLATEYPEEIPSVTVVQKMVDDFEGLSHHFFTVNSNDNDIMLYMEEADTKTMLLNLKKYLEEYREIDKTRLECIVGLGVPLSHRKIIYNHAVNISKSLGIVCPQILSFPVGSAQLENDNGRRQTIYDENIMDRDVSIGDCIYIKNRGRSYMVHSLAHEMRHSWQEYVSDEGFYKNYKQIWETDPISHAMQKEEIDAEAYASLYLEKKVNLANGIRFIYPDEETAATWKWYDKLVIERMKKISI